MVHQAHQEFLEKDLRLEVVSLQEVRLHLQVHRVHQVLQVHQVLEVPQVHWVLQIHQVFLVQLHQC